MRTHSRELANAFISAFKAHDYNYQFDAEKGMLTSNWTLRGKIRDTEHVLYSAIPSVLQRRISLFMPTRVAGTL